MLFLPLRPLGDGTIAIAQSLQGLFRYFFYGKSLFQIACRAAKFKRIRGNRIEAVSPSIPGIEDGENLTHRKFRPALKTPNISAMLLSQLGLGFETRFESFF